MSLSRLTGDDATPDFIDQLLADKAMQAAREKALAPPPKRHANTNGTPKEKWLESTFHGVIEDVRNEPEGNRNGRLRWGARRLAEISHGGLDESRCKRELERAAQDSGVWKEDGAHQCRATIESGWTKGIAEPEDLSHVGTLTGATGNGTKAKAKTNGLVVDDLPPQRVGRLIKHSTIKTTVPQWVWEYGGKGRIQLGTLTMFAGKPAAGKSTAARWFASRLSRGELPGIWEGHPMKCCMLMMEEQTECIVVPGLEVAGADTALTFDYRVETGGNESTFGAIIDERQITDMLIDNEVRALFVDPIMATIGAKVDAYRANEVREYLAPYTRMATAINGIVIGITHLKKGEIKDVLGGINGSSAFGEVPRAVLGFSPVPGEPGENLLEQVKNSAGPCDLKLSYQLPIAYGTADDGQPIALPVFKITGETDISISDLDSSDSPTAGIDIACEWLKMYLLENGPTPSAEVKKDARAHGDIGEKMILRAAKRVGVVIETKSMPDKPRTTVWWLPGY